MPTTYKKILTKGYQSSLDETPIEEGKIRWTVDTAQLFLDHDDTRMEITDFVKGLTEEKIRSTLAPLPKIYLSSDTHKLLIFNGSDWLVCGEENPTSVQHANVADNADKAIKDNLNQNISSTYIKQVTVKDTTITFTKGDNSTFTIDTKDTTYPIMTGANSNNNGASGLVPQPTAGNHDKFLKGDATWAVPSYAESANSANSAGKALADINNKQINTTYAPLNSPIFTGTPVAPTAVEGNSSLTLANTQFVMTAIANAISNVTSFDTKVVTSFSALPNPGVKGVLYFVPSSKTETSNIYDEYVWTGSAYEKLGPHSIDLTGYYNSIETTGTGNAVTSVSTNGNKISFNKGASFLTSHPSVTKTSTTGTAGPSFGGTVEVVDSIVTDNYGHLTSYRKKTVTIPNSTGNSSTAGLTKLYDSTGSSIDGTMTRKAITDALGGKAASNHTHNYAGSNKAGGAATTALGVADGADFDFGAL